MSYLIKSDIIKCLKDDMELSLSCYKEKCDKDIVRFCYESMVLALDRLSEYRVYNVTEDK